MLSGGKLEFDLNLFNIPLYSVSIKTRLETIYYSTLNSVVRSYEDIQYPAITKSASCSDYGDLSAIVPLSYQYPDTSASTAIYSQISQVVL